MKKGFITSLLYCCVCLSYCASRTGDGIISVERDSIHLGEIDMRDTARISYTVSNAGDGLLEIKTVGTSCGCSKAYLGDSTINPRQSVDLRVNFTPTDTGDFKKYVVIETNSNPVYKTLVFTGTARRSD
jgi:hypothetical protein